MVDDHSRIDFEYVGEPIKNTNKKFIIRARSSDSEIENVLFKSYFNRDLSGIYSQLRQLTYSYWPRVYDVWYFDSNTYIVEEEILGKTLWFAIHKSNTKFLYSEVALLGIRICKALSLLHELNPPIIHRDIKPDNIIIPIGGYYQDNDKSFYKWDLDKTVLIDFDISRKFKETGKRDTELRQTDGYAPPEQYGFGQTDARSDIYSLGVTMHEMITGNLLDSSNHVDTSIKTVSPLMYNILCKCVKLNKDERFQSANELRNSLEQCYLESVKHEKKHRANKTTSIRTNSEFKKKNKRISNKSQSNTNRLILICSLLSLVISAVFGFIVCGSIIVCSALFFGFSLLFMDRCTKNNAQRHYKDFLNTGLVLSAMGTILFDYRSTLVQIPWLILIIMIVLAGVAINRFENGSYCVKYKSRILDMVYRVVTMMMSGGIGLCVEKLVDSFGVPIYISSPILIVLCTIFASLWIINNVEFDIRASRF